MRIVVSGTHASGKSTLISDFVLAHSEFAALPDPFELIDESWDAPNAPMLAAQLRIAADRLHGDEHGDRFIAERGPIDFLAYLRALDELAGGTASDELIERATAKTLDALGEVDLLVVLPLSTADPIQVGSDEDLELREAMDQWLLELVDDPDVVPEHLRVVELTGDRGSRLAALEAVAGVA
ncbi:AAA family ATPase [Agromyces sp. NPDC058064]|uniref:AAA family ATPase n=1 Tax=Agromyces sp. NPDC058064 TaxID=3346322 RepID=UPI0036DDA6F3